MGFSRKSRALTLALLGITLAGCNDPEQKAARYLERGNKLFKEGQYEKARIEYKNVLRLKPTAAEPRYRIGLVEEAENHFLPAFADFLHAEEQDAHFHPALLRLAKYYLIAGQDDQAEKRLSIVLSEAPDDSEAHALHASLLSHQKDYEAAEKEALEAIKRDPANITGYAVLIGLYVLQKDDNKAIAAADEGLAANPGELSLVLLKAQIYDRQQNFAKLAEVYQVLFKLKPEEGRFRSDLAALYLKAGKVDEAEKALRDGTAVLPNDWGLKYKLVAFLGDQRGIEAAEKEVQGYMKEHPEKDDLYKLLVDTYLTHGAVDRAMAVLNGIIDKGRFDKQGIEARAAMARIDYVRGDKESAKQLAASVLEKQSDNIEALLISAQLAAETGFYDNAVADLRTILRAQPRTKEALQLLAETLVLQGHTDLAIDTLNQLLETDPADAAVRVRLAQLYHLSGDSKHAMDILFLVTKTQPRYAPVWETIAATSMDLKDWPTAKTAIDTLDNIEGESLATDFLRGQLLEKTGKVSEAMTQYTKVIDADPSTPLAERALASYAIGQKSLGHMEEAAKYIASLKTDKPGVQTILGECYADMGRDDMAAPVFDKAIAAGSLRQETYLDRAKLYLKNKQTDEAIAVLEKAATLIPADARTLIVEAGLLAGQGKYENAIKIYSDLLARNPELDVAANNMAEMIADYQYSDPKALERARHVAERFVASTNPLLLDTLSWVYYRQGDIRQAQVLMERAMAANAKLPPQMHYHYGSILMKAGKTDQARAELQQAVAEGASYPGIEEARKLLADR